MDKLPPLSEKHFEGQVKHLAKIFHVDEYYHPFLSKWSAKGFPDLTIIKVPRLIFVELKGTKGKVSPEQQHWHDLINQCTSVEAHIWWPEDYEPNGGILAEILRGV